MKIFNFRWMKYFLFILAAMSAVSCSPKVGQIRENETVQPPSVQQLKNLEVVDLPDSTQILLEAEGVFQYTSFTLSDPPRLVIDLSDISLGEFKEPIVVNKGSVVEIYPIETDMPIKVARLNIKLVNDTVESKIYRRENALIIEVQKTSPETPPETAIEEPTPDLSGTTQELSQVTIPSGEAQSQPTEEEGKPVEEGQVIEEGIKAPPVPSAPAVVADSEKSKEVLVTEPVKIEERLNVIKDIKVMPSDDRTDVIINAEKDIDARIFIVEDDKLVIDVKDATISAPLNEIPVENNKIISKVRIGQHTTPASKIRIVADLKENITYDVGKGERILTVGIHAKVKPNAVAKAEAKADVKAEQKPHEIVAQLDKTPPVINTPPPNSNKTVQKPIENNKNKTPQEPETAAAPRTRYSGKRVSLDFQDADIINVLRLLGEVSRLNMVIGDNVKGKVTIKMLDVPWDQALDVILKLKGLGKVYEDNVLRVDTLSNISQQQEEEAKAKESIVKAEDLATKILPVNYARARDISESVKKVLSTRGDLTVDDRTNTLIIKDIKDKHEEVRNLLGALDKPTPQVLIEARIVQADSNFARDLGIQWGGGSSSQTGDYNIGFVTGPGGTTIGSPTTGFAVNLPASGIAGPKGSVGFTIEKLGDFNLDLRLSAGETKGLTKVLSAPKIATLDNREATIQQGESIPYKTVSQEGTKTEFIDATLTLKVTPKVTPDGHIAMNIKISKNRQGSIVVEGTPSINKKEATTEVLVKDGETTVIGGIYETTDVDNLSAVPWFHKVPVVGWLFKSTQKSNIKSELLIFITPKIIPVTT